MRHAINKTLPMNLKFFLIAIFLLPAGVNLISAQNLQCQWAVSAKGNDDDRGGKIAIDPEGNTIVTGRFRSKDIIFGNIKLVNADQDSSTSDAFIVKYSP